MFLFGGEQSGLGRSLKVNFWTWGRKPSAFSTQIQSLSTQRDGKSENREDKMRVHTLLNFQISLEKLPFWIYKCSWHVDSSDAIWIQKDKLLHIAPRWFQFAYFAKGSTLTCYRPKLSPRRTSMFVPGASLISCPHAGDRRFIDILKIRIPLTCLPWTHHDSYTVCGNIKYVDLWPDFWCCRWTFDEWIILI